ncbi:tetratricopeptide repeat protein [Bacillus atrophaeus]|uniref:response regulator aspartate phosphatase n=1 Tax=Bacillus atrophaeus TaxID=1452 RepID=UPI002E1B9B21|nr:tetratricopeptide repeat protein [Bacillus atrophaeus]
MKEIASVDVANLINRWYVHIRKREISAAVELRDEILAILDHMEEDQDLLVYFNLLDYRFKVLMEDISSREPVLSNEEKAKTDDMLRFYFFLFKGMFESAKNNYSHALSLFRMAEKQLDSVYDEIEKAEFHYKLGSLYYFTKTTLLSFHHLSTAKDIYKGHDGYEKQVINCTMLLALNYIDDGRLETAEQMLKDCVEKLIKADDKHLLSLAYYDLGFLKIQEDKHNEAIHFFDTAFKTDDLKRNAPIAYLQCVYESARSNYKIGETPKALEWIKEGIEFSEDINNTNFSLKFSILNLCYSNPVEGLAQIKAHIDKLEARQAYVDIEALAVDVANVYSSLNNYKESTYFLEKAIKSSNLTGKEVI